MGNQANVNPAAVCRLSRIASPSVVTIAIFPPKAPRSVFHAECSKENPPCTANRHQRNQQDVSDRQASDWNFKAQSLGRLQAEIGPPLALPL